MIGHSFKNMLVSLGVAYDFAFCQNRWSLKIFQNVLWSMSCKNAKIYQSVWGVGGSNKKSKRKIAVWCFQIGEIVEVPERTNNIFKDVPIYFLIFFEVFGHNKSHKYGASGLGKSRNHAKSRI